MGTLLFRLSDWCRIMILFFFFFSSATIIMFHVWFSLQARGKHDISLHIINLLRLPEMEN